MYWIFLCTGVFKKKNVLLYIAVCNSNIASISINLKSHSKTGYVFMNIYMRDVKFRNFLCAVV